jgi:hypothetical protein
MMIACPQCGGRYSLDDSDAERRVKGRRFAASLLNGGLGGNFERITEMKVFVWERAEHVTNNWHAEGGLVIFAETEERARELANAQQGCELDQDENPDEVRDVAGGVELVFVMPDAGCC